MSRLPRTALAMSLCMALAPAVLAEEAGAPALERRTLDTEKVTDLPPTRFSFEVPVGWTQAESIRDQFQLIVTYWQPGGPYPVKVWARSADAAMAEKWLAGTEIGCRDLARSTGERDGFKTRRALDEDKEHPAMQSVRHALSKPPHFFIVEATAPEPLRATLFAAADKIAETLRLEP